MLEWTNLLFSTFLQHDDHNVALKHHSNTQKINISKHIGRYHPKEAIGPAKISPGSEIASEQKLY